MYFYYDVLVLASHRSLFATATAIGTTRNPTPNIFAIFLFCCCLWGKKREMRRRRRFGGRIFRYWIFFLFTTPLFSITEYYEIHHVIDGAPFSYATDRFHTWAMVWTQNTNIHAFPPLPNTYLRRRNSRKYFSLFFCCCCLWYLLLNQYIAPYISKNEIYVCMKMALANAFVYDRAPKRSDTELKINPNNSVLPLQKHRERERDSERKIFVWMRVMWMNSGSEIEDLK